MPDRLDTQIRPIRAADKAALTAGFARLSDESRRLRFLAAKPRLTRGDLRYLTEVDGHDHIALVALDEAQGIVGVARCVRDAERPDTAELAIVVVDDVQGQGVGGALADAIAAEARAHGITRFTATVLRENEVVQRLIARISRHLEHADNGGVRELVADLAA